MASPFPTNEDKPKMDSLSVTDAASAAVAKAPRVSLDDIKANIVLKQWVIGKDLKGVGERIGDSPDASKSLGVFTLCFLVMRNGFVVVGKSAPASAENFDPALGKQFAYEDAVRQIWPLMGYSLRDRLVGADEKEDEERKAWLALKRGEQAEAKKDADAKDEKFVKRSKEQAKMAKRRK